VVEPTSKLDAIGVLDEIGIAAPSYPTIKRRLPVYATAGVASGAGGLKGFITNLDAPTPDYVLGAYHQLWQIEKSFRMSRSDLRARPIYHHKPDSIEAHLTIVMAALAVSRWLERVTGWSIKKLVQTLRRCRSIAVHSRSKYSCSAFQAGDHILHAGTPSTTCEQPSTPSRPQPLDTALDVPAEPLLWYACTAGSMKKRLALQGFGLSAEATWC
jgi:hypothetical protein